MTQNKKIIIAIDGPAASGKGSLAKKLAAALNYDFLDTGALYRRAALKVMQRNIAPSRTADVVAATQDLIGELDKPYDDAALRSDKVGSMASQIAQIGKVRDLLRDYQQQFPKKAAHGAVLDGRDIGTVICPEADIKFFITASVEKRAERRHKELQSRGINAMYAPVLEEMQERDARDAVWLDQHLAPKRKVHIIDTSDMTPEEVLEKATNIVEEALTR